MGLFLHFLGRPSPRSRSADIADHGLPTIGNVDMLDRHLLLALRTIVLEGLNLRRERPGELVEGGLGAVLLRDIVDVRQASPASAAAACSSRNAGWTFAFGGQSFAFASHPEARVECPPPRSTSVLVSPFVRAEHFGPLTELFQPGRPGRIGPGASTKARPLAARTGLHYTK